MLFRRAAISPGCKRSVDDTTTIQLQPFIGHAHPQIPTAPLARASISLTILHQMARKQSDRPGEELDELQPLSSFSAGYNIALAASHRPICRRQNRTFATFSHYTPQKRALGRRAKRRDRFDDARVEKRERAGVKTLRAPSATGTTAGRCDISKFEQIFAIGLRLFNTTMLPR